MQLLRWLGGVVGMSYKAINVWIFCVLWPMFTILLLIIVFRQRMKIRFGQAAALKAICSHEDSSWHGTILR